MWITAKYSGRCPSWVISRRIRPACFSGVCPVLPESDSYRPKSLASLSATLRPEHGRGVLSEDEADEAVSPLRQAAGERPNPARPPENIPTPRAAGIRKPYMSANLSRPFRAPIRGHILLFEPLQSPSFRPDPQSLKAVARRAGQEWPSR